MKFSKKSRYGMIALIDLAVNSKSSHVALNSIAEQNGISPQYLEQIFAALRRAGIVKSVKGPQGGYLLNHAAGEITVSEILEALEGDYRFESEQASEDSKNVGISAAIQKLVIDRVNQELENILMNLTLADLEKEYLDHEAYGQDMYYI
ncbi:RrF2 family transcriptional regulator [Bariatricus sp. SGI.154]|uniref:RrF2 family transcriptional regulator n=1 Tax=Bariatricus sp. SGI.154 TaxID=3420549 RepID=UPI003D041A4E